MKTPLGNQRLVTTYYKIGNIYGLGFGFRIAIVTNLVTLISQAECEDMLLMQKQTKFLSYDVTTKVVVK